MPGRPVVLLAVFCAGAAALGPVLVLDTAPSRPRVAVAIARTSPADLTVRTGDQVDAPWVVHPAVRPLLPGVDVLLVRDPGAGPPAETVGADAAAGAAAAGRRLRAVAAPSAGLPGLAAAVRAAGPPPGSGRVVLWQPAPAEQRCSAPDPTEQPVVAALVGAGARVLPLPATGPACTGSSTAGRVATLTGGAPVTPADLGGPSSALVAATVQLRLEPVCEPGLRAAPSPAPRTALSGTPVTGRWAVRVERDVPAGAVLSCVLLPHVDGAPALDAVQALTVRVTAGGRAAATPPPHDAAPPPVADLPAADLLEDVGEQLLDVLRLQDQLRAAARRGAPSPAVDAVLAVLDALADQERALEDRRDDLVAAADAPDGQDGPPQDAPAPAPRPAAAAPAPGRAGLASADSARRAVDYALAQLGEPYVWGATGPSTFDCSGLTSSAYASAGVRIPRVSRDQFHAGVPVRAEDLLPGDLVFFARVPSDPRTVHHVAMALGEGRMVHAPQTGDVVRVVPLRTRGFAGAVRVVGAVAAPAGPVAVTVPAVPPRAPSPEDAAARVHRGPVLPGAVVPGRPLQPVGAPGRRPAPVPTLPTAVPPTPVPPVPAQPVPTPPVGPPPSAPVVGPQDPGPGPAASPVPTRRPPVRELPPLGHEPPVVVDPTPRPRPPVVVPPVVRPTLAPVVRPPVLELPPVVQPPGVVQPPVAQPPVDLPVVRPPALPPVVLPPVVRVPLDLPVARPPVVRAPLDLDVPQLQLDRGLAVSP